MLAPAFPLEAPRLDQGMRDHLAASLERIARMAKAILGEDADLEATLGHVRGHRVDPGVFGRYYDLVFALQAGDHAAARKLWGEIAETAVSRPEPLMVRFGAEQLGEDADRFSRLVVGSRGGERLFAPPADEDWRDLQTRVAEGLDLLAQASPAWAGEIEALVARIIAAAPRPEPGAPWFNGASCFMLWGALFINAAHPRGRLDMLSTLAHEATHQLLFALSREEPLVKNPPAARYRSPFRKDPRPMDGVFHATFVAARLSVLYEALRDVDLRLTEDEAALVGERVAELRGYFERGYAVVAAEAELTPLGRRLIEEAADRLMAPA